jgi:hypothetical protein
MKKILSFILVCLFILPCVYANDNFSVFGNRTFEFSLMNFDIGFSNDYIGTKDIFKETVVIDLDEFEKGFNTTFGLGLTPFYFSYHNKSWGFGLATGLEATGAMSLSGKLLSFGETKNDDGISEVNGALFAEIGIPAFFHFDRFKIKVRPAFYYPLLYTTSNITYVKEGNVLNLGYEINAYMSFAADADDFRLTASNGVDIHIGVEYPLSEMLGLSNLLFFLDFDVGLDLINIPLIPAKMKDYMTITGSIGSDKPLNFFGDDGMDEFASINDGAENKSDGNKSVYRPFKAHAWAAWRPLGINLITITPTLGFAINPLYVEPASFEGGIKGRLNLFNLFSATLGIGHYDRLWKNSLDLALNIKLYEVNFGINLQSPDFAKSFTGAGFGASLSMKFGW